MRRWKDRAIRSTVSVTYDVLSAFANSGIAFNWVLFVRQTPALLLGVDVPLTPIFFLTRILDENDQAKAAAEIPFQMGARLPYLAKKLCHFRNRHLTRMNEVFRVKRVLREKMTFLRPMVLKEGSVIHLNEVPGEQSGNRNSSRGIDQKRTSHDE